MPIKDAKRISIMQDNVLCISSKFAKHIPDIRGTPVFECPGDSIDFNPIQDV